MTLDDLDTPTLVIDEVVARQNLERMAARAKARGFALRPHTKTHKTPYWARAQAALGSSGLTVAKLGEADVMVAAGFLDLLIAYPIIGPQKQRHLARLIQAGLRPTVSLDSREAADSLEQVGQMTDSVIGVLVEVDSGFHRCGLPPGPAVADLARYVESLPHLRWDGLMVFGGHMSRERDPVVLRRLVHEEDEVVGTLVATLRSSDLSPRIVSTGGTPQAACMDEIQHATELRPGTYIYNDVATVRSGAAAWEDCAATVLATVVSRPDPRWAVVDAGSKALSSDGHPDGGHGAIVGRPDLVVTRLSEEHGILEERAGGQVDLAIGERIRIVPNHVCTAVAQHDAAWLIGADGALTVLPIAGRGRVR
jgi:D-serine deaminase-like pyridoxal phosphate-dependent protein